MAVLGEDSFHGFIKWLINNNYEIEKLSDSEIMKLENKYFGWCAKKKL